MNFQKNIYWLVPILAFMPQLAMTLSSFNQIRFEELYESVVAPYWFWQGQIINGLHVNVGWYAFLVAVYNLFGFSLHTGKISYLLMAFFSNFALFYLLRRFFKIWLASLILFTITLSPTYLYMNAINLHWALTFHILIAILVLLYFLDFARKRLSLVISGIIFILLIWGWLSYQAFVFYIPSLVIFYFLKIRKFYGSWRHLVVSATTFLLPLLAVFVYVDSRHILIADSEAGGGLFRGGGSFVFYEDVFSQAWTDFISDFFIRGVSHHYEVVLAEFSFIFPILSILFMIYVLIKTYTAVYKMSKALLRMKQIIILALLVIVFNAVVYSTTSDLGMPGMKRLTPMLAAVYFLWVVCWHYMDSRFRSLREASGNDKRVETLKLTIPRTAAVLLLSLLTVHHMLVYPANLSHIRDLSPFAEVGWLGKTDPQKVFDQYVDAAGKGDLMLDCRPILERYGSCSYEFMYFAVKSACFWNNLNCHGIKGYNLETAKFENLVYEY